MAKQRNAAYAVMTGLAGAVGCLLWVWLYAPWASEHSGYAAGAAGTNWLVEAGFFLAALTVVGVYDVWLPRGDPADMSGALAFAAGVVLGPHLALVAIIGSRLTVAIGRLQRETALRVLSDMARRVAALSWSMVLLYMLGGPTASGGVGYARLLIAAVAFFALDIVLSQVMTSARLTTPLAPLVVGTVRLFGWMIGAHVSVAVLTVIVSGAMGPWGLFISVALLLVMRQSFSLLIETKLAYRATVEVLALAMEAHDPARRGHAERVSTLSTEAARELGMHGNRLEQLTYAALFHDVGSIGADESGAEAAPRGSAEVLADVGFLAGAIPTLRILDARGDLEASQQEEHLVAAYVIARMSDYDDARLDLNSGDGNQRWQDIGARLYLRTRTEADRAVARVCRRWESGRLLAPAHAAGDFE